MRWTCANCDIVADKNPTECPNCGQTIFKPVKDKGGKAKVEIDTEKGTIRDLFKS